MDAIPVVSTVLDNRNLSTVLFYTGLFLLWKHVSGISEEAFDGEIHIDLSCSQRLMLALALLTIPFLPASNLFFYVGFVIAERILYIPSMGFSWIIAEGMIKAGKSAKRGFYHRSLVAGFCAMILVHSARTWMRNMEWKSEEHLYLSGVNINPAKSWSNLGTISTGLRDN